LADKKINWLLLGRYALLIALTVLIPIPLLDRGLEKYLRRRMVRHIAKRHDAELTPEALAIVADPPGGGCMGCLWSIVLWPFKKILKTMMVVFQVKTIADMASEVLHRGLMLEEAFESGWLPREPEKVRLAMDQALEKIDTRLVERALRGTFQDNRHELNLTIHHATELARMKVTGREALADAAEKGWGESGEQMTTAMTASLRATGIVPELLQWFRAEMGDIPKIPTRVEGVLEAETIEDADTEEVTPEKEVATSVEDAIEVAEE
jgi:hypothetical protein